MADAPGPRPDTPVVAWADQAADAVENVVGTVRDRAVVPVQRATSGVVFGLLAAFFAVPALVLTLVGLFRVVDAYLPGDTWATWLVFGGIFLVAGAFCWTRRHPRAA